MVIRSGESNSIDPLTPLQFLKGVGPVRAKALAKQGLETLENILYYFPRRYLDRRSVTLIKNLRKGDIATVIGKVVARDEKKIRRRTLFQIVLSDGHGHLTLTWFNGGQYVKKAIKINDRLAVHGKIDFYNGYQITHPEYDKLNTDDDPLNTGSIIPLYPLNQDFKKAGLDNLKFRKMIRTVLNEDIKIPELYSSSFMETNHLIPLNKALQSIHFAQNREDLDQAIYRLKFDEHLFLQLLMAIRKKSWARTKTKPLKDSGQYVKAVYDLINFDLTGAQKRVLKEIRHDLSQNTSMNRLLQGDVGSGKTIVALLAASIAIGNQAQVAVMAPTEILAYQHLQSFKQYTDRVNIDCELLVGNTRKKERDEILNKLESGDIQLVIGTHALIQEDIKFKELGLVIVDEQHRFGVVQRGDLTAKGYNPHLLAMTATPIPRTLAITYHGDMDISVIDEMPLNRSPIITKIIGPERLPNVHQFIIDEVAKGRQAMIVYPLVEESEKMDLEAAVEAYDKLSETVFKNIQTGLIHGRLKKEEKDRVMDEFSRNQINILFSTTVIEVGIDIPNATVMLIDHADRFGLTQLHQLRGRVGRGSEKSYCILVQRNFTENSKKRLSIMEQTQDGFKISDEDLKLRGPGEFFGIKQSGFLQYKIANMVTDGSIIRKARQAAIDIIEYDPQLRNPEYAEIRRCFLKEYHHRLDMAMVS